MELNIANTLKFTQPIDKGNCHLHFPLFFNFVFIYYVCIYVCVHAYHRTQVETNRQTLILNHVASQD